MLTKRASVAGTINPARGALAILSLAVLGGLAVTPAYAQPFTDINGHTCDTSQLIENPTDPNGPSVCPGGGGGGGGRGDPDTKVTRSRTGRGALKFDIWSGYNQELGYDLQFGQPPAPTFNQLGMTVTPETGFGNGVAFGVGGYSARSSGVGVTDTAGLLAPGSVSTASRTSAGSGGLSGSYDVSSLVGSNQKLILDGAFNYTSSKTSFSAASGSINSDSYDFKGSVLYSNYRTYLVLSGAYEYGNNSEFFAGDASSGSYRSDGYNVDARLGHVFVLFNSIAAVAPPSRMPVKAAPRAADGGYAIGLDLSGHLGYSSDVAKGFTDSSGFVFGDERAKGGETGIQAKLFAAVPRNGVVWQPYISGSVDWRFDYSHIASFPTQVALAGGDAVAFADGTTFVGAQAGLDVRAANGWIIGVNGFYSHSSDTDIAGGRAYVRIPFGPVPVAARY
jgi:Autotransporter beta-domain